MRNDIDCCDRLQRCLDLARAVEHLHDKGLIHGNIRADNITISDNGDVKLTDFGDATLVEHLTFIFTHTSPLLAGNVRFTAPEILDETIKQRTAESDMYALGMTMIQILTGKVPYAEDSDMRVLANVFRGVLPPRPQFDNILRSRYGEEKLWSLLMRCWEHDPKLRPTATEVKQGLIEIKRELNT